MSDEIKKYLKELKDEFSQENLKFKKELSNENRKFKEDLSQENLKLKEEFSQEAQRYIGVLSEDFQHKLDVVVEGHQVLNEKIDDLRDEVRADMRLLQISLLVIPEMFNRESRSCIINVLWMPDRTIRARQAIKKSFARGSILKKLKKCSNLRIANLIKGTVYHNNRTCNCPLCAPATQQQPYTPFALSV